jgi:hypothetical protein
MQAYYTAQFNGKNTINIIDLRKNAVVNRSTFQGQLLNGPIVVGDRCTIVVEDGKTKRGLVIKLPSGAVVDRFTM